MSKSASLHRHQDYVIVSCSGVQIKTRKRNIAVALDPGSFADAVVAIFEDQKDGDDLEANLLAGVKVVPLCLSFGSSSMIDAYKL